MSDNQPEVCTITVRVIRSLQYKNWKPLVVRSCNLDEWTLSRLREVVEERLKDPGGGFPPPYTRDLGYYDCIKMETDPQANRIKSSDALINITTKSMNFVRDREGMECTLRSIGMFNECEVSIFNSNDYDVYLKNRD